MGSRIIVAGGTGNLGHRIINALMDRDADVRALVRSSSDREKVSRIKETGAEVVEVDMTDIKELSKACKGAACVVSALQGLREVIVDAQALLLDAAVAAGVPKFIPSDFAVDFTRITSENRNFDLRREFHHILHQKPIAATSIYNGAFADILTYNTPILDVKNKSIGYWGDDPDWKLDFTTMDDTAAFTAASALDPSPPKDLHIASFQVSPNELVALASEITKTEFELKQMGSLEQFDAYNKQQRRADPEGENKLYPKWQSGQYMHDQFSTHHERLDNKRYPDVQWTSARAFLDSWISS